MVVYCLGVHHVWGGVLGEGCENLSVAGPIEKSSGPASEGQEGGIQERK